MKTGESDIIMELTPQLSGDLDTLSFVRVSWLNWMLILIKWVIKEKWVMYLIINPREAG